MYTLHSSTSVVIKHNRTLYRVCTTVVTLYVDCINLKQFSQAEKPQYRPWFQTSHPKRFTYTSCLENINVAPTAWAPWCHIHDTLLIYTNKFSPLQTSDIQTNDCINYFSNTFTRGFLKIEKWIIFVKYIWFSCRFCKFLLLPLPILWTLKLEYYTQGYF